MNMFTSSVVFITCRWRKSTIWRIQWFGYSFFNQEPELSVGLQIQISNMKQLACKGSQDMEAAYWRGCAEECAKEVHTEMCYGLCMNNGSFWGNVCRLLHTYPQSKHRARKWKKNRNTVCLLVRSPTANEHRNEQRDSHRLGISLLMLSHQGPLQGSYLDQSLIKTSVHVSTHMQLLEKQSFLRISFYILKCSYTLKKKVHMFVNYSIFTIFSWDKPLFSDHLIFCLIFLWTYLSI